MAVDDALVKRPADFPAFLDLMKQSGYEYKRVRGGGISFRHPDYGQDRFTRLRASTLGEGYDEKDILAAINGSRLAYQYGIESSHGQLCQDPPCVRCLQGVQVQPQIPCGA